MSTEPTTTWRVEFFNNKTNQWQWYRCSFVRQARNSAEVDAQLLRAKYGYETRIIRIETSEFVEEEK